MSVNKKTPAVKKNVPIFNTAGDLLVTAAMEWRRGNKQDALIIAAGALDDKSMEPLAIAMHMANNAAQEGVPVEQILQPEPPVDNGDTPPELNNEEDLVEELPVDELPDSAVQEPDQNIRQEVSRILKKIIKRESSNTDHTSPFEGPGGDLPEGEDSARNLNEDEIEGENEGDIPSDYFEDEDADGLTEDEPDPANPKDMAEHPAEASELDENIVDVDEENPDNGVSNLGNKLRILGDEVDIPAEARATINRISYTGKSNDRALAEEFARTYRKRA